jgi:hypothetical protein
LQYIDDLFSAETGDDDESDGAAFDQKIVATIILLGFLRQSDGARVLLGKYWDVFEESSSLEWAYGQTLVQQESSFAGRMTIRFARPLGSSLTVCART